MHNAQFFVTLCFVRHEIKDTRCKTFIFFLFLVFYVLCFVSKYLKL